MTAMSAQASDMSGWLLMGLPGAIYLAGMAEAWIAIGLFIGTSLNWMLVSAKLRVYTQKTNAITLPCFFEARFRDPTGLLRIVSLIIILVFFAIYASSGLVATGKLFESTFDVPYHIAVIIGGLVVVAYTFMGGFLAVCWTDLLQGVLMVFAILIVPALTYKAIGGAEAVAEAMQLKSISTSLIPQAEKWPVAACMIVSSMAWGLGYFGQPHILVRFMSIKSAHKLRKSMTIAIVWVFLSLASFEAAKDDPVFLTARHNFDTRIATESVLAEYWGVGGEWTANPVEVAAGVVTSMYGDVAIIYYPGTGAQMDTGYGDLDFGRTFRYNRGVASRPWYNNEDTTWSFPWTDYALHRITNNASAALITNCAA